MLKLWLVFWLVGLTMAGDGSPIPISEEAVVKSDRVGNNFAYSIRHEQRSIIPASSSSGVSLSDHPVNVPNVYPSPGVGPSSSSSSSSSSAAGGAVHQFNSASSTSTVSGTPGQQQQELTRVQAQTVQQQQEHHQQQSQQHQHRFHQQQEPGRQQHDQQLSHHQQQELHRQQQQKVQQVQQHHQQHEQQSSSGVGLSGPSSVSNVATVSGFGSNAIVQSVPAPVPVASPVLYQPVALGAPVVAQPTASVEVLPAPATAAAVGVYHPPAAVGLIHYPPASGATLVQSASSELSPDSTQVVRQPTLYITQQVPASPVYTAPEPVAHPQPTFAVYSAEVARPGVLKLIDASALKWAEVPAQKWAQVLPKKTTEAAALAWGDAVDTSSPLRFGYADPAAVKFAESLKYVSDSSGSKYVSSDSSKFSSVPATSGLISTSVLDNKLVVDQSKAGSEVGVVSSTPVKSETGNQDSISVEAAQSGAKFYSAPAIFAATPYQQAVYDSVPRQYYSAGLVPEQTFYATRISSQPVYSPVPVPVPVQVQQALVSTLGQQVELHSLHDKAQVRGFPVPIRQIHFAAARQPVYVTGLHQASGQASSHETHSQSSSNAVY